MTNSNIPPLLLLRVSPDFTLINFVPTLFPHNFFISVDNPTELIKILCYIDKNDVLRNLQKQIEQIFATSIDKFEIASLWAFLSITIGKQIPDYYFDKTLKMISSDNDRFVIETLKNAKEF